MRLVNGSAMAAAWLCGCLVLAAPASAQDVGAPAALQEAAESRADLLRSVREAKQKTQTPYEPGGLENTMHFVEEKAIFLLTREGFYPKLGSLTTGSGFAGGLGYRNSPVFNWHGTLDVFAAASMKGYWAAEARASFPQLADGRVFAEVHGGRREYTEEDYFGLGPDARRADQVTYSIRRTTVGAMAGVRPAGPLGIGGGVEFIAPSVGRGEDPVVPSIGDLFDESTAPGLARQPDFLRSYAFLEVDYRRPLYARNGGWYRVEFSHYGDRDAGDYTFNRVDVDLRQYVSFLGERRVLSGRALVSTSDASDGRQVPFYFMPYLGGNDTLRGFREYRFRGPHALLLQAEYRIEIWPALDLAFFYDAGKVAERRSDLDFANLEDDYGFGFRFNTDNGVVMRVDAGFGSRDGNHLYITFGGVF